MFPFRIGLILTTKEEYEVLNGLFQFPYRIGLILIAKILVWHWRVYLFSFPSSKRSDFNFLKQPQVKHWFISFPSSKRSDFNLLCYSQFPYSPPKNFHPPRGLILTENEVKELKKCLCFHPPRGLILTV